MRYFKAIVEYDGSNYHGFQRQVNALAIQEVLEKSLYTLTREEIKIIGASRTDSGVHAEGQTINFKTRCPIPIKKFAYAWNNCLPNDIIIKDIEEVDSKFHARYDAQGKIYEYHVWDMTLPSVFTRNYSYHIKKELNLKMIEEAAKYLEGTHDFSSFRASGCGAKTTERNIESFEIERDECRIIFKVEGNAFLYNMVRIMVGTLIEVGLGKLSSEDMKEILRVCDRTKAGPTAPAHGLRLIEVKY
jgi:tRNA pseudouridine38-40 synthase